MVWLVCFTSSEPSHKIYTKHLGWERNLSSSSPPLAPRARLLPHCHDFVIKATSFQTSSIKWISHLHNSMYITIPNKSNIDKQKYNNNKTIEPEKNDDSFSIQSPTQRAPNRQLLPKQPQPTQKKKSIENPLVLAVIVNWMEADTSRLEARMLQTDVIKKQK